MIFSCFPASKKCEWRDLIGFVNHYNNISQKAYRRSKCLDVELRNQKEPELLLEAPGEVPIVIERKSVVWPSEYLSDHANEHDLYHTFVDRIRLRGNLFSDSAYQLTVNAESLRGKGKREVRNFAEQIADFVVSAQFSVKSPNGISNEDPIPWRFRHLSLHERDETVPDIGIGLVTHEKLESFESFQDLHRITIAKSGYSDEFNRIVKAAAEKFTKYSDCERLLVVQFFGNSSIYLQDEEIVEIITTAQLPDAIDQVWLARQEWISESDYEIAWDRVR